MLNTTPSQFPPGDFMTGERSDWCMNFDRAPILPGEVHAAGVMWYAASAGLGALELCMWSLEQCLLAPESLLDDPKLS
jgi:hypothetical protein